MKIFKCGHCSHSLFFENDTCENCGHLSGYRESDRMMLTFRRDQAELISDREGIAYKFCKNKDYGVCNWLIEASQDELFCKACQLNRVIPNLSDKENFSKWQNLEVARHRLVYQLQKIGLELLSKVNHQSGFCFDFVVRGDDPSLMTGHADGVITILLREADSAIREKTRLQLKEPYRTLIGHLRHEVGHYFWDRLVTVDELVLGEFRDVFGDERSDYGRALGRYYDDGAPDDWNASHISKYATSHPWEDWAETWAHYLHIMDMVETAYFFGLSVDPVDPSQRMRTDVLFDPYIVEDFGVIVDTCVPLSFAINSITRAMGVADVYPFVISSDVVEKMRFIHNLLLSKRKMAVS